MEEKRNSVNLLNVVKDEQKKIVGDIIKARQEKGISQRKLGELSGVKQPIIARMEKGDTTPQLETVLKILYPLEKKLAVVSNDSLKGGGES